VRAHTTPQRAAKRARIVLLAADGVPNRQIAPMVGMSEHTVAQWRQPAMRFASAGVSGRGAVAGHHRP
jgi:transposase